MATRFKTVCTKFPEPQGHDRGHLTSGLTVILTVLSAVPLVTATGLLRILKR